MGVFRILSPKNPIEVNENDAEVALQLTMFKN